MSLAYRISGYNRRRKWQLFLKRLRPSREDKILDAGFSEEEYSATDNFLEKNYAWQDNITALGIEEPIKFQKRYPAARVVKYDGKIFPFQDKEFNIVWSNAVLEHVGDHSAQRRFLREIKRVGQRAFITTPNRCFPIEVHTRTPFLHWLPKCWFDVYLNLTGRRWAAGDYMRLLSFSELKRLLAEAGIKDYQIIKNRLLGLTLDFVIVF